ncbi:MAG: hypothetical protein GY717_20820 [Rhodobacteraceae bacterium]|nr:hypothetical protein [Paracoccaceae bacterium]
MEYRRKHDRHRPRGWFSLFFRLGGWLSLIFGALLIVLTLISASQLFLADQLDRDGKFTRAVVGDKRMAVTYDSDADEERQYFVTFIYKSSEGGQTTETGVSGDFYDEAVRGDELVIRYLRSDPGQIEYEIGSYRKAGNVLRWIGLVLGLIGLLALWRYGKQANRAVKARRDGDKIHAEVTGIRELKLEVNNRSQARLQWREPDGRTGESLMRGIEELSRLYQAGDRIVVFRLGDDAFWEGDVGPPWREIGED